MDVKLIVVVGKASKRSVSLKLPSVIGRSQEADLTVSHPMVSRRHCEIFDGEGLLKIRDLESLNGTVVDGQRISEATLRPNDQFTIGPLTFRAEYRYDGPLDAVPTPTFDQRGAEPQDDTEGDTPESNTPEEPSEDRPTSTADPEEPAAPEVIFEELEEIEEAEEAADAQEPTDAEKHPVDDDEDLDAFLQELQEED